LPNDFKRGAIDAIDEKRRWSRRAAAKASTEELGRWPFRRPLKKQAAFWQNEAKKLNFFQGGPAAFGAKS
jgi:hypothetical protein